MPVRARLALSFAIVTLVLVALGGLLFARSFRSGLEESLEPGLRTQATALAQQVRERGAVSALDDTQAGPTQGRDVVEQVLDRSGHVLASTREAGDRPVVGAATVREATRARTFVSVSVGGEREPYRVLAAPVETATGRQVVIVATSLEATDEAVARVRDALLIGGASAVVLAAIGGWFLSAAALRPVERMRRQAAEISAHDAASRLEVPPTRDELAALAATMNELLTRLHDASARQRSFVADAGHELRTPLAVLRTELELANRPQRDEAELRDALEHVADGVDRLARLAEDLLLLARADEVIEPRMETARLADVLDVAVATATEGAGHPVATVTVDVPTDLEVRAVPSLLRRAVENVLENALRYAPVDSTVTVRGSRNGSEVVIEVADHGPGFPPEFLRFAFERFRRADDARSRADGGTGLGLAIVRSIAELHGGTASARNAADGGAVVTFSIVGSEAPPVRPPV